jgi:protein TonB
LSHGQLNAVIIGVVALHILAGWGLLQIKAVRDAVAAAAPMMFEMVREPAPIPPAPPPQLKPIAKVVPPTALMATPTPSSSSFVVELPEPDTPKPAEPVALQAPPAPAATPPPKMIPASAIQYRVQPQMEYPRASRPFRESGRVTTRVYVDATGMPRTVLISQSSGFPRLDAAAIQAVNKARFKPYTENGEATAGWALITLNFELE